MKKKHYLKPTTEVVGVALGYSLLYSSWSTENGENPDKIETGNGGGGNDPYGGIEE